MQFQQSESTAERRRWIIVLVQDADPTAGLTGATGQVYVSKNGGTPALSTNSLVEVDSTNMPGHYYIELTAAELDTLGGISIVMKTASSKAFHDRGLVSYNDPYISAGGFSGGGSSTAKITKKQLDYIAKQVWEQDKAKELMALAAEHPVTDLAPISEQIKGIVIPTTDLTPVLDKIDDLHIPQPADYSKTLTAMQSALSDIKEDVRNTDLSGLKKIVAEFENKTFEITKELEKSSIVIPDFKIAVAESYDLLEKFSEKAAEVTDMDKRFENMTSVMQKQSVDELRNDLNDFLVKFEKSIQKLLITSVNNKYDILKELKQ